MSKKMQNVVHIGRNILGVVALGSAALTPMILQVALIANAH